MNYSLINDASESVVFDIKKTKLFIETLDKNIPLIVFGFTYMLYAQVVKPLLSREIKFNLPEGSKIIHIGGWKKLESEKISKDEFNKSMTKLFSVNEDVIDVYGFTEQIGLNYPDCECGYKHTPLYSEVLVRNPVTREVVKDGEQGILEFISPIPHSYPGNLVITDDLGYVNPKPCPNNRNGTRFKILGRLKKAEIRGCGDVLSSKLKFSETNIHRKNQDYELKLEVHYWKGMRPDKTKSNKDQLSNIIEELVKDG